MAELSSRAQTKSLYQSRSYYDLAPRLAPVEGVRSDFRTTVFWKNDVVTDNKGIATVEFYNNEATSAFRITAEGISQAGLSGRCEQVYTTQLPLSIDAKLPNYLGFRDTLQIPVMVRNNTKSALKPELSIRLGEGLQLLGEGKANPQIAAGMSGRVLFSVIGTGRRGLSSIEIKIKDASFSDFIRKELNVYPTGIPCSHSLSGNEFSDETQFEINDIEPGTLRGEARLHINLIDELFAGVASILREPYGCFEQTSSATFPNIFVLQLMEATGQGDEATRNRALQLIERGYNRLTAYEIKGGGFEWFGNPPANETLTAYGLIEFFEMQKVYKGVDRDLIQRTKKYLLERRNSDGSFKAGKGRFDHLSKAPYVVNAAYITYALSEVGEKNIEDNYQICLKEALKSKDLYRMALMALTAHNLGKKDDYRKLTAHFEDYLSKNRAELDKLQVESTIVCSYGQSVAVETIALWTIALLRDKETSHSLISTITRY